MRGRLTRRLEFRGLSLVKREEEEGEGETFYIERKGFYFFSDDARTRLRGLSDLRNKSVSSRQRK